MELEIKYDVSEKEWKNAFNEISHPDNFFMDWTCSEIMRSIGWEPFRLLLKSKNKTVCIFQAMIIKNQKGLVWFVNMRSGTREGEGLLFSKNMDDKSKKEALRLIVKELKRTAKENKGVKLVNISFYLEEQNPLNKSLFEDYKKNKKETLVIDLTKSEEELWNNLESRKVRNAIKQGQTRGTTVEKASRDDGLKLYYEMKKELWKELDTFKGSLVSPSARFKDQETFTNFARQLVDAGIMHIYVAKNKGQNIAFASITHKNELAIYTTSAYKQEFQDLRPMNVLLWEIIKNLKDRGFKKFDLCGATRDEKHPLYSKTEFKLKYGPQWQTTIVNYKRFVML